MWCPAFVCYPRRDYAAINSDASALTVPVRHNLVFRRLICYNHPTTRIRIILFDSSLSLFDGKCLGNRCC